PPTMPSAYRTSVSALPTTCPTTPWPSPLTPFAPSGRVSVWADSKSCALRCAARPPPRAAGRPAHARPEIDGRSADPPRPRGLAFGRAPRLRQPPAHGADLRHLLLRADPPHEEQAEEARGPGAGAEVGGQGPHQPR